MNKLSLLLLLPGMVAINSAFAQSEHLKLSTQYPAAGEKADAGDKRKLRARVFRDLPQLKRDR